MRKWLYCTGGRYGGASRSHDRSLVIGSEAASSPLRYVPRRTNPWRFRLAVVFFVVTLGVVFLMFLRPGGVSQDQVSSEPTSKEPDQGDGPPPWGDADPLDPMAAPSNGTTGEEWSPPDPGPSPSGGGGAPSAEGDQDSDSTKDSPPDSLAAVTPETVDNPGSGVGVSPSAGAARAATDHSTPNRAATDGEESAGGRTGSGSALGLGALKTTAIQVPAEWPELPRSVSPTIRQRARSMIFALSRRGHSKAQALLNHPTQPTRHEDIEVLARMARITFEADLFWKAVERAVDRVSPGDTLTVAAIPWSAEVIDKSNSAITLRRSDGKQWVVSILKSNMRSPMASALAEWELRDRGATRYLPLAVFWSLEQNGHPEIAARYWQSALDAGLPVDALDAEIAKQAHHVVNGRDP